MKHFADRLIEAVERKRTPAIVGLDPRPDLIPAALRRKHDIQLKASPHAWAKVVAEFSRRVLDVVAPLVPAVKLQSAFYEMHGAPGIRTLEATLRHARRAGLVVILDAKRGDIGSTSEAYAQAAFGVQAFGMSGRSRRAGADAVTVSPYLGRDSLEPFLRVARAGERGLFVLVRTSNPGSADLQQLSLMPDGFPVYRVVADWVRDWSEATRGRSAYGSVGAVVGGTAGEQIAELRQSMPHALLLIPGYGAQGATARDLAAAFDARGLGALINSSRGVLFPNAPTHETGDAREDAWEGDVEQALRKMIDDLAAHTPAGELRKPGQTAQMPSDS